MVYNFNDYIPFTWFLNTEISDVLMLHCNILVHCYGHLFDKNVFGEILLNAIISIVNFELVQLIYEWV